MLGQWLKNQKRSIPNLPQVAATKKAKTEVKVVVYPSPQIQIPKHLSHEIRETIGAIRKHQSTSRSLSGIQSCVRGYMNASLTRWLGSRAVQLLQSKVLQAVPQTFGNPMSKRRGAVKEADGYPLWKSVGVAGDSYLCMPREFGQYLHQMSFGSTPTMNHMTQTVPGDAIVGKFEGKLRPFQTTVVDAVVRRFRDAGDQPCGSLIIASCGTGKTVKSIAIICAVGRKCAIVVHKEFLLTQWKERLSSFAPSLRVGVVQRDLVQVEDMDVVLFMMHSLVMREGRYPPETFASFGLVIFDETHHIAAKTFVKAAGLFPAQFRLGLTATPNRADGLGYLLTWVLGPVVCEASRSDGNRVSVRVVRNPTVYKPIMDRFGEISYVKMVTSVVDDEVRSGMIERLVRRILREDERRCVLVASDRVGHLRYLHTICQAASPLVKMGLYIGTTTKRGREEREENGRTCSVLFTTFRMGEEGLDIPRMNTLVLASPKKQIEQLVGRITRGKMKRCSDDGRPPPTPTVYDVVDDGFRLFASMFQKRRRVYNRLNYSIEDDAKHKKIVN